MQIEIVTGWSAAARELDDLPSAAIAAWPTRRRDHVAAGRSTMRVGHVDLFARPIDTR
jgi:hypothetical protein